jgi:Right handed beta helix region
LEIYIAPHFKSAVLEIFSSLIQQEAAVRELLRVFMFLMGLTLLPHSAQSQQPTVLYVSQADPRCDGSFPCFTTIQAAINAASPGAIIRISAGTYRERLTIDDKNNFTGATEASRIIIEANPLLAAGSVIVRPPAASCATGYGVLIRRSRFITIRGLTITGATGAGIILNGGSQQNFAIHVERSRIVANSNSNCALGGISIALGNPDTLIVNTQIHGNGGNGITFVERSGGPHWLIQNTIHGNSWNGVGMVVGHTILMVNNSITGNGQAPGTVGGRYGVVRPGLPGQAPESARLLNNLICGNRLGEIQGPVLDSSDSNNLTPLGNEGPGVSASSGCDGFGNLYADANGPDNLPHTIDDDFSPSANSPAIDRGMDPRTLGLSFLLNSIFEDDYASDFVRPADGNGDRILTFDIGAFEVANEPPVADAEPDQTTFRGVLVAVNGNRSYDP